MTPEGPTCRDALRVMAELSAPSRGRGAVIELLSATGAMHASHTARSLRRGFWSDCEPEPVRVSSGRTLCPHGWPPCGGPDRVLWIMHVFAGLLSNPVERLSKSGRNIGQLHVFVPRFSISTTKIDGPICEAHCFNPRKAVLFLLLEMTFTARML